MINVGAMVPDDGEIFGSQVGITSSGRHDARATYSGRSKVYWTIQIKILSLLSPQHSLSSLSLFSLQIRAVTTTETSDWQ